MGFPDSSVGKESACNAGDPGSIPGLGRSPGEGIGYPLQYSWASLVAQLVKNPPAVWETWVRSLCWEDPGGGKGCPLQYSCLENSMDCIVHGVIKSRTRLRNFHFRNSITMNKASGGNGIPAELFQILKDDAVKVLHLICQQFGKLSSGHRTGNGPFSFQSQRRAMPKNVQTTTQLHSFHMPAK